MFLHFLGELGSALVGYGTAAARLQGNGEEYHYYVGDIHARLKAQGNLTLSTQREEERATLTIFIASGGIALMLFRKFLVPILNISGRIVADSTTGGTLLTL